MARITISVTPTFASKWLIPNLACFTANLPGIDLRILATETVSSFHSDGVDLAVRQARPPFGASLDATLLFRHEVISVCAPDLGPAACSALAGKGLGRRDVSQRADRMPQDGRGKSRVNEMRRLIHVKELAQPAS